MKSVIDKKEIELKMEVKEGCVVIDKSVPSLWRCGEGVRRRYERVMERTQDIEKAMEALSRVSH